MAQVQFEFDPNDPLDVSKNPEQLWLIRIPLDFPLSSLCTSDLEIPQKFTLKSTQGLEDYTLQDLNPLDLGELKDMQLIVPDAAHECHRGSILFF